MTYPPGIIPAHIQRFLQPATAPPPAPAPTGEGSFSAALASELARAGGGSGGTLGDMLGVGAAQGVGAPGSVGVLDAPGGGASGNRIIATAEKYLGIPYKWGGTNPSTGLDCSGFTQRVFADLGVSIPRVSKDQSRAGQPVASMADARPGDLVYWGGTGGRPNHIGIYVGNGQMMHAPRTGDVVRYAPLRSAPPDAIRRVL